MGGRESGGDRDRDWGKRKWERERGETNIERKYGGRKGGKRERQRDRERKIRDR